VHNVCVYCTQHNTKSRLKGIDVWHFVPSNGNQKTRNSKTLIHPEMWNTLYQIQPRFRVGGTPHPTMPTAAVLPSLVIFLGLTKSS